MIGWLQMWFRIDFKILSIPLNVAVGPRPGFILKPFLDGSFTVILYTTENKEIDGDRQQMTQVGHCHYSKCSLLK